MNTKQRTRSVFCAAVAAGVALFIGGCGTDESGSGGDEGAGGTTSAPEHPDSGSHSAPGETGAQPAPGGSETATEEVLIVIKDFAYTVPETVPAGATITVRNDDSVGHTVTSDEEGVFDVPVGPGEEATLTAPSEPGEYPFHCTPHPDMVDTLVVG